MTNNDRKRPLRVPETNKYIRKTTPDFGSSSRRAQESTLSICGFRRNAEDGPQKSDAVFIYFRGLLAKGGASESLSDGLDLQFSQPL
jgi:hypothetical protein